MTKIKFKNIDINKITNSSGVHSGVNIQHQWKSRVNSSDGFGNVDGKSNNISNNVSFSKRKNGDG
ncbi:MULTISPECIES: hypothetical protein [unclassified Bacillus (in: firmicutes)]|uniref:hypothetical protein n=1 Tax=unclassified Bacillus (in: firmicutes) TaxID=185979 RepID=UPI001BE60777|nr:MULTISPECIES: hypothetical protein [unclassified Bacillus (in: firmicutes)]MBT2640579.1 hypothetical protein [Bacillus sp. ISL-39]MBT2663479.1 hypothetical protein [Bacillus sp. ISL-45]